MDRIGVRELRQHASRYLARVEKGESYEITDRGRPVAMLVPVKTSVLDRLIATGRAIPPSVDGDVLDEPPQDYGIDASANLAEMREHER